MSSQQKMESHSQFALNCQQFRNYLYTDLFGPKFIQMRHPINLFKGFTFIWILFLMWYFDNYSNGMKLYLFLHGTYGIFWLLKDILCPDQTFKQSMSVGSFILLNLLLILYWAIPLSIATQLGIQQPSSKRIKCCVITYIIGIILMLGSDIQKNMTLAKKKGLISTGFFSRTRNPNYLGQILIYGSFAACSGYWASYALVIFVWITLFGLNMYLKEEFSYKLKAGWKQYKEKSYIILPKIFKSNVINCAIYAALLIILYNYYSQQCCDHHHHHHQGHRTFDFHDEMPSHL